MTAILSSVHGVKGGGGLLMCHGCVVVYMYTILPVIGLIVTRFDHSCCCCWYRHFLFTLVFRAPYRKGVKWDPILVIGPTPSVRLSACLYSVTVVNHGSRKRYPVVIFKDCNVVVYVILLNNKHTKPKSQERSPYKEFY